MAAHIGCGQSLIHIKIVCVSIYTFDVSLVTQYCTLSDADFNARDNVAGRQGAPCVVFNQLTDFMTGCVSLVQVTRLSLSPPIDTVQ